MSIEEAKIKLEVQINNLKESYKKLNSDIAKLESEKLYPSVLTPNKKRNIDKQIEIREIRKTQLNKQYKILKNMLKKITDNNALPPPKPVKPSISPSNSVLSNSLPSNSLPSKPVPSNPVPSNPILPIKPPKASKSPLLGFTETLKLSSPPPPKQGVNPNLCDIIYTTGSKTQKNKYYYPSEFPKITKRKPITLSGKKGGKRLSLKKIG